MMVSPIVIRTSERNNLKVCPQRWWWGWRDGLKPKTESNVLWFGAGIHLALAQWYRPGLERGKHPAKAWFEWVNEEEHYIRTNDIILDEPKWIAARDLGASMLYEYIELYGEDSEWNVIATEQPFQLKIPVPSAPGGFVIFAGTFDGVFRDRSGALWLMEHKTAGGFPNIGFLELDDQASGYFLAAEIVLRHKGLIVAGEHLNGIMYNYLRKAMPDDRPKNAAGQALNKDGSISKRQDTERFLRHPVWRSTNQRIKTQNDIAAEVELMMMYRNDILKVTKSPGKLCPYCPFFSMCQLHEAGEDWTEYRDAMYTRRDPYSDHRLAIKSAGDG